MEIERKVPDLPPTNCLMVALATPIDARLRPDHARLAARAKRLVAEGCDGVALFGTTGEGAEFSVADRTAALEAVIAAGVDPGRLIVSAGAMSIADAADLARHATDQDVDGILLMPPCVFREGITEDGTFRFFRAVIERVERPDLRLYLYHFPDISGVPVTPEVIRRLDERYPGTIAGVKDSGGDSDYTQALATRFSHLSIFTGTEIHLPELLATGMRGTICGMANVMPRLMRAMVDLPTAYDRRQLLPHLFAADAILSRRPFIVSAKAVLAGTLEDDAWRRVLPPLAEMPVFESRRMVSDFVRWDAGLPRDLQSLSHKTPRPPNVVPIGSVR